MGAHAGRRRVGKSRLVEEFVERAGMPSLRRLPHGVLPEGTQVIGAYWTRSNDPQIDLVGADREPVAQRLAFVGSITWQSERPVDGHDLARLGAHRARLPGADETTALVAVSRSGASIDGLTVIGPDQLLAAYR